MFDIDDHSGPGTADYDYDYDNDNDSTKEKVTFVDQPGRPAAGGGADA